MKVEVVTPEEYVGGIIGDLTSRRGQVQGQEMRGNAAVINAKVPLANMFGYGEHAAVDESGPGAVHHAIRSLCPGAASRGRGSASQVRLGTGGS